MPIKVAANSRQGYNRSKAINIRYGERPIIHVAGPIWEVPSQSGGGTYSVNLTRSTCSCPAWKKSKKPCKHIGAARLMRDSVALPDGEPNPRSHDPYPQPPYYDRVKQTEAQCFRELVRCLVGEVPLSPYQGMGRPKRQDRDLLACALIAKYDDKPGRKAIDPILLAPILSGAPPAAITLRSRMKSDAFRDVVRNCLRLVSDCVRRIDTQFAVDATVLRTPLSQIHIQRLGAGETVVSKIKTAKLHLAIGTDTLMVHGCDVSDGEEHETNYFPSILAQFWDRFRIDAVLADAAYCSSQNFDMVYNRGGRAFIDFKLSNTLPSGCHHYNEQLKLYREDYDEYLDRKSLRALAETVNSALKRTVSHRIRARLEMPRETEALLMVLAYNLCRLLMVRQEFDIDIPWLDSSAAEMLDACATGTNHVAA